MKLWLICYDIADNKRRYHIDKVLMGYGDRVQYSAFECFLTTTQLHSLQTEIKGIVTCDDKIHLFSVCGWCKDNRQVQGCGTSSTNNEFYGVY